MIRKAIHTFLFVCLAIGISAQHPVLILNKESVPELRQAMSDCKLWNNMVGQVQEETDLAIAEAFDVPVPVDPAGGYTHAKHKQNAILLKRLGALYQVTENEKYARYAKNVFMAYAQMFPSLGAHPVKKSYAPGRLFWQQLNDAVWLVDAIQGYDCIYDYLSGDERKSIEEKLLRPYADFLSVESKFVFNRIHNHGVWAVAAVGMTGFALQDEELICRALYGIDENDKPNSAKVGETLETQFEAGFLTQTRELFSPDGYYTEGPYYQRYAMTPFLLFAQSIQNNIPDLGILEFEDQIFFKAIETLIQLTDDNGGFFSINDNLKGMSLNAPSMIWAVDMLYANTKNPELLDLAKANPNRHININGLAVIMGLSEGLDKTIIKKSLTISDGKDGNAGGIAIMRDSNSGVCAVVKAASQGLVHGHFDRLNVLLFKESSEVLSDYGAARIVNLKSKEGGRYLPENESYAKQTVAHNTVVVNEQSNFNGIFEEAQKYHSDILFTDFSNPDFQISCATESNAYQGKKLTRTVAVLNDPEFNNPIVIDVFNIESENGSNTYDLPYHFLGQITDMDFDCSSNTKALVPMGEANGYQHIWKLAEGKATGKHTYLSWMYNKRIYSITTAVDPNTDLLIGQIGAFDPNFNLRPEPMLMIRQKDAGNHTFASIIESHGWQNPNTEVIAGQAKQIKSMRLLLDQDSYTILAFSSEKGSVFNLCLFTGEPDNNLAHSLEVDGVTYSWKGAYNLIKN